MGSASGSQIADVASEGSIRNHSTVVQQKTGRPVKHGASTKEPGGWLELHRGTILDCAFPPRIDYPGHLSTRQYARLADEWFSTVGLYKRSTALTPCDAGKPR